MSGGVISIKLKIKKMFSRSKKGTVIDILPIIFLILIIGAGALIGNRIITESKTQLVDNEGLKHNASRDIMTEAESDYSEVFDIAIPLVFVGLCLGMIIGAFLIRTQPVFFIVTVLLLLLLLLIIPVVSNIFEELCDNMSTECANFQRTQWIFDNMAVILTICGFITGVVLYAVYKT